MWRIIISGLNVYLIMKFAYGKYWCSIIVNVQTIFENFHFFKKLGDLDSTFHRCCSLGQNKTLNPLKCESKIRTPVVGVAIEEQSLCLSTVELCCIQTLR